MLGGLDNNNKDDVQQRYAILLRYKYDRYNIIAQIITNTYLLDFYEITIRKISKIVIIQYSDMTNTFKKKSFEGGFWLTFFVICMVES